jgi:serine/threonine-protein kinase PknG
MTKRLCEIITNGKKCGGTIADGFCTECGAIYDDAILPAVPETASSPTPAGTIGGNSLRSNRGSSRRIALGRSAAAVQGLTNVHRLGGNSSQRSSSRRRNLGGGFVDVPPVPEADPLRLLTDKWNVPVEQRFCANPAHQGPVPLNRRDREGKILDSGVCTKCGTPYSFPISPGTVIANQFEVVGTIAKGGCGYVYLVKDLDVGQWAVVKGVLTNSDEDRQAAVAEKAMLAKLRHPAVVTILGFKTYQGQPLIAMEFIDGQTVEQIYEANGAPLPVAQAIAYVLAMCQASIFLHEQKPPVYNPDIKPGNYMVKGSRLIMIDAGGCVLANDPTPTVTSTVGFAPREVDDGSIDLQLSPQSDIYSLGRVLLVLSNVVDFKAVYRYSIPDGLANFDKYPSYAAFIKRATAEKPEDRFNSVAEMESQLWGVLREVVAIDSGASKPLPSDEFDSDTSGGASEPSWRLLPGLKVNAEDPAHGEIETALKAAISADQLLTLLEPVEAKYPKSREAKLRRASALIEVGQFGEAERLLGELALDDPFDYRPVWYRGRLALAAADFGKAVEYFSSVVFQLPGEPAAKLGLGLAAELARDEVTAITCYDLVMLVEPSYTMAAFGHARCLLKEGNRIGAVKALRRVPQSSIAHVPAEMQAARALLTSTPAKPTREDLIAAAAIIGGVRQDNYAWHRLVADLYLSALDAVLTGSVQPDKSANLLQVPFIERSLREACEGHLMACAHLGSDADREQTVAEALAVAPRRLF